MTTPDPAGPGGGETAIVTGATSGIGLALSALLASKGYALVLVARDERSLDEVAARLAAEHAVEVTVIAADLAGAGGAATVAERVASLRITPHVLVNNAGRGVYGPFLETPLESELEMIHLNVVALTELTKRLLPSMVARRRGMILNLASIASFIPGPLMAVYYATKAYVLSFGESLAHELEGTGVTITTLCPPPTRSGFQAIARMEASRLVKGKALYSPDVIARAGYAGMIAGRRVVIPGFLNWLSVRLAPLVPRRRLAAYVARRQAPARP
jgi:short-subunit dehydrogenase